MKGPTFRNEIDPEYKANRQPPPEDLVAQLPIAIEWVEKMGFATVSKSGYEADDKDYVSTFIQAFDALKDDKTDLIVVPKKAAIRLCLRAQYKDIKRISPVLKKLKLYHFVHAKNTHLIAKILPILEQMKKSGEINYIEKSYLRSLTKCNN